MIDLKEQETEHLKKEIKIKTSLDIQKRQRLRNSLGDVC
jgi:hypothetical protein